MQVSDRSSLLASAESQRGPVVQRDRSLLCPKSLVPKQPWVCLADKLIKTCFRVLPPHFLVLQQHGVLNRLEPAAHQAARPAAHYGLQRLLGNQGINQSAIPSFGHTPQCLPFNSAFL